MPQVYGLMSDYKELLCTIRQCQHVLDLYLKSTGETYVTHLCVVHVEAYARRVVCRKGNHSSASYLSDGRIQKWASIFVKLTKTTLFLINAKFSKMLLSVRKVFVTLLSIVALFAIGLLSTLHVGQGRRLYIAHVDRLKLSNSSTAGLTAHYDHSTIPTPPLTMAQMFESRRVTLQEACAEEFNNSVKTTGRAPSFFYSRTAKLACCRTPKTGSSFWGTVILAIESKKNADDTFHTNRNSVHNRNLIGMQQFRNLTQDSLRLMVSREPYTRLFSAYVDKYFLLGALGRQIKNALKKGPFMMNGGPCGYAVSFVDFLNFVTDNALKGADLNEHFMPIVKLCDPCRMKFDIISRQETLTKDTQFVLEQLKLSDNKKTDLQNSLKKGIKNTLYALVSSYLSDYKTYSVDCPNKVSHFEKVWKTLQVQGYVSTKVAYPKREFQKMKTFNADAITLLIIKEMERFPLGKEDKALQRRSAVSIAYADVGQETIAKIQKVYKMDFLMFGYEMTPPNLRPGAITL
ncbi:uncharacterized protein LOC110452316 isoform X4 [Mizuhopecten yessoensis]|uniref:Carbohydrate sulfotransferase n=1 Tax=Mizuhopecten yessoensis TaxID=6573 RepID=A0A210QJU6_MIZYE|nr:uncharacterized protein LOC110452316 isoform X4 [Mizuhopecten yessoensis]OWF49020.1 Carbohydrate sulfotransferase 14 [Mizuhopecten yessoensis]